MCPSVVGFSFPCSLMVALLAFWVLVLDCALVPNIVKKCFCFCVLHMDQTPSQSLSGPFPSWNIYACMADLIILSIIVASYCWRVLIYRNMQEQIPLRCENSLQGQTQGPFVICDGRSYSWTTASLPSRGKHIFPLPMQLWEVISYEGLRKVGNVSMLRNIEHKGNS